MPAKQEAAFLLDRESGSWYTYPSLAFLGEAGRRGIHEGPAARDAVGPFFISPSGTVGVRGSYDL